MKHWSWVRKRRRTTRFATLQFYVKILTLCLSEHRKRKVECVLYVLDRFNLKRYRGIHSFYFILPTARDKPISKHAKSEVSSNEESMFRAFEGQNVWRMRNQSERSPVEVPASNWQNAADKIISFLDSLRPKEDSFDQIACRGIMKQNWSQF